MFNHQIIIMNKFKSLVLTVIGLLCSISVSAHDFEVDGIYYNITSSTDMKVEVTYHGNDYHSYSNEYSGAVNVPESVTYNGSIYSVTSIGYSAFRSCKGLTSVEIPNSVTSIGSYAFYDCFGLTSVEIPNSVISIGYSAYEGCWGVTSVHIDDIAAWCNIEFGGISANPLYYAKNLYLNGEKVTELVIPNSVTSIEGYAFYGCSGLTSVEIGNSVTSIGSSAFYGTAWYENQSDGVIYIGQVLYKYKGTMPSNISIIVRDGTVSISPSAFNNCLGLTSVEIGNSVTSIGDGAFYGCSGLTSVEIGNSVTSIGNHAFDDCSSLTSVVIPNSVTSIGDYAFYDCKGLTSVVIPNSVTSIGSSAFEGCSSLTSVVIPNSVTSIEREAFSGCSSLTSVEIPNSVTSIGSFAFSWCSGLTSVEIGNSVTSIGDYAFRSCKGLTSVEIGNSVTSIGGYVFEDCSGLTSVEIPNSVTSIGESAFSGCSSLTSVHIDDIAAWCNIDFGNSSANPLYYAKNLYLNGEKVTELVIPNSVISIGGYAFYGYSSLTSVVIPNSVTSIEYYAFYDCDGLTSVVIPNSVTSIGDYAFNECNNLKVVLNNSSLTFAKGSSDYGYIAYYAKVVCNGYEQVDEFIFTEEGGACYLRVYIGDKTELVLPANYKGGNYSIGENAFYDCSSLTSVVIPNSVTGIGESAFQSCSSLTSVEIGNSVTYIGDDAFYGCSGLTSVEIPNSVTCIWGNAFARCTNLLSITLGNSIELLFGSWSDLQLRTIICLNPNAVDITQGFFSTNTYNHAVVYVPEDSYWNYAYSNWGAFIHIKEIVTEANSLQSRKAYMIADSKGTNFKVYDAERDALKNVEYTHALDEESEDCCWTVMKENGNTYLYNLGAKKFGAVGDNGAITLSETPVHVAISETEGGLSINGNNCMFVLNKHVEVDATGISEVLLNGQDAKNAQIHSLDGRRQQTLKRGVNIVNGKKVFVQ